ncbi:MEDS domain-containing protein [Dactylosporangium sp. CA-139066]|uniref:MEDS domain-containing protein n=1 Tax=Dactylosporangium sp. CA-139066 TaxID=3239930 RepID=UPI003D9138A2
MAEPVGVERLPAGGHACLTFSDPDERLDLLAAFVGDGLERGQRVVCYTDAMTPVAFIDELDHRSVKATVAATAGQLLVADCSTLWSGAGAGTALQMLTAITAEIDAAGAAGYRGLRVSTDMAWATRPHAAAQELLRFEEQATGWLRGGTVTTMCQYDRGTFDPVTLAFAAQVHPHTVAAQVYHDDPLLRICRQYRPAGVRIAGELDFRHLGVLEQALAEALRLDADPQVNLRRVRYLDAACAAAIVRAAGQLSSERVMDVPCASLPARVLRLCGAAELANLRLTEAT